MTGVTGFWKFKAWRVGKTFFNALNFFCVKKENGKATQYNYLENQYDAAHSIGQIMDEGRE